MTCWPGPGLFGGMLAEIHRLETICLRDDRSFYTRMPAHQIQASLGTKHKRCGGEDARHGASRGHDRHRHTSVINWKSIARINDVSVTPAIRREMSGVITGRGAG